mgnify:CR=1 FL=1
MWALGPPWQRHLHARASEHYHREEVVQAPEAVGHPHGQLDLVVDALQDAVGQGKTALAVALKLIKGEKVESHVWIPFELVTKENMQTYVEKSH